MYFILIERLDIHSKTFSIAAILNFGLNFFIIKYGILAAAVSTALAYLVINLNILYWLKINLIVSRNLVYLLPYLFHEKFSFTC